VKTVLTIAGSDPSGGAGIQVDLMAFHSLGVHGVTALTAVTSQNEKRFFSLNPVASRLVREQIQAITATHRIDAIKIGMLGTEDNVFAVYRFLDQLKGEYKDKDKIPKVVLDPVFKSSTGALLIDPKGMAILTQFLVPLVTLVTPNLDEAETMSKMKVRSEGDMREAALHIHTVCKGVKAVLVKGGHLKDDHVDVLYDGKDWTVFPSRRKFVRGAHGTGCALSAAIAAHLARGYSLEKAIERSKEFVSDYIRARV
jgi:hydroxymethylpyrimidine/phosphomethylpyrimidine kinase